MMSTPFLSHCYPLISHAAASLFCPIFLTHLCSAHRTAPSVYNIPSCGDYSPQLCDPPGVCPGDTAFGSREGMVECLAHLSNKAPWIEVM